tara:strand:+ start:127 stop:408 length:282 start_codon:yes stop_codon:yes gene_type:complete
VDAKEYDATQIAVQEILNAESKRGNSPPLDASSQALADILAKLAWDDKTWENRNTLHAVRTSYIIARQDDMEFSAWRFIMACRLHGQGDKVHL